MRNDDIHTIISDAQGCLITKSAALGLLAGLNVHGAFDSRGAYTGYDYTKQQWIAYHADGSLNHGDDDGHPYFEHSSCMYS